MQDSPKQARPSCYANYHMTVSEYGFYDICRSLAASGILYFDGRGIAKRFRKMSKDHPYKLLKALKAEGWFEEVTPPRKNRHGKFTSGHYRVLTHEQWAAKFPDKIHPATEEYDAEHPQDTPSPVQKKTLVDEVTSPTMGSSQSDYGDHQSEYGDRRRPKTDITSIQPLTTLLTTPLLSHTDKEPVRLKALDVSSRGQDGTKVGASSAPEPVQLKAAVRMPETGRFPVPPCGTALWVNASRDQYFDSDSKAPVPLAEAWQRIQEVTANVH